MIGGGRLEPVDPNLANYRDLVDAVCETNVGLLKDHRGTVVGRELILFEDEPEEAQGAALDESAKKGNL